MNIRASMLPGYVDCSRRAAAKQWRKAFEADGYTFRQLPPSVGAAAGTAVHKGVETALKGRWEHKKLGEDDILQPAFTAFQEETEPGCQWDDTTPNSATAQQQIRSMISAYLNGPGKDVIPLTMPDGLPAVELFLEANAGDGWLVTGTMDIAEDHTIRDLKTGALMRPYQAQLGTYGLLAKSNKIITDIRQLCIDFVKRAGKTKPQPACVTQQYPVDISMKYARGIIQRIQADFAAYKATGDLDAAFMANPMSMMHSEKFCPAFKTKFCRMGEEVGECQI
jgi:hypothetical protein